MDKNNKSNALLIGTITYAIGSFGTKFLSLMLVPLYTYYILPTDLGKYDLLLTTVSLISPLLTMKISDAAYSWMIKDKENQITYISATYKFLLLNCVLCALFILGINHFVHIWNGYYFVAILIGNRILECLQKLLRGIKNQKLFAASGLFYTVILVGSNLLKVCYLKEGVLALLQSTVISLYATIILILLLEKRLRNIDFKPNYRKLQKEMLHYSIPLVPSALSWWVMSVSDRYVIRWILGSVANGIYSVAYKFPSILQMVFTMFNNAWTDMALAELGGEKQSEEYVKNIFQKLYKVSFGMVFVLIPLTKLVMKIMLSSSYKESAIYIGFIYMGTIFQGFSSFCSIGYLQGKRTDGVAKTSIYGAIVNLIINLMFIKFIGLFAASISTFLGFFAMWLFRMKDIEKDFPIRIDLKMFTPYLIVGVLLSILTIWTDNIVDLVLACIALVFLFMDNKDSLKQIQSMVKKKKTQEVRL